jgi:hypothetical protein
VELDIAVKDTIEQMGRGKALSRDLIPDDCFNKDELFKLV